MSEELIIIEGGAVASAVYADSAVSASSSSIRNFPGLSFGTGGKLAVIIFGQGASATTLSTFEVDGNTVTVQAVRDSGESKVYIGTVDVGAETSGDVDVVTSATWYHFGVILLDLSPETSETQEANPSADASFSITYPSISESALVIHASHDQNGGATGHSQLGNYNETSISGSAAMAIAWETMAGAETDYDADFTGTAHGAASASAGVSLPVA